jgi:hypothetical protein
VYNTEEVYLILHNYLLALGTRNENTSKYDTEYDKENYNINHHISSVINVTGEIPSQVNNNYYKNLRREVRGSILVFNRYLSILSMKGPKSRLYVTRAYSTSSNKTNYLQPIMDGKSQETTTLDGKSLEILAFESIARL